MNQAIEVRTKELVEIHMRTGFPIYFYPAFGDYEVDKKLFRSLLDARLFADALYYSY